MVVVDDKSLSQSHIRVVCERCFTALPWLIEYRGQHLCRQCVNELRGVVNAKIR